MVNSLTTCKRCGFQSFYGMSLYFSAELKNDIFRLIGVLVYNVFIANLENSYVIVYLSVSIVFDNLWSFGHCSVRLNCLE